MYYLKNYQQSSPFNQLIHQSSNQLIHQSSNHPIQSNPYQPKKIICRISKVSTKNQNIWSAKSVLQSSKYFQIYFFFKFQKKLFKKNLQNFCFVFVSGHLQKKPQPNTTLRKNPTQYYYLWKKLLYIENFWIKRIKRIQK